MLFVPVPVTCSLSIPICILIPLGLLFSADNPYPTLPRHPACRHHLYSTHLDARSLIPLNPYPTLAQTAMASFAELPTELYEAIFSHIAYSDLQQVVLAVTRAIPLSAVPLQALFESISVTRPQQAIQVYRRLRQRPSNGEGRQEHGHHGVGGWVRNFTIDTWEVDADVVVNILPFLTRLHSLTICVGPKNFAPEHLEEIFTNAMPSLRTLSLRFKP